jgi:hypothetical protein
VCSYAAKPYAVYASSFEEVLLFDAGIIPFVDPSVFFTFSGYTDYGCGVSPLPKLYR